MKIRRLAVWLVVFVLISLFSGISFCLGANLVVRGDEASDPNPNEEIVTPPPVVNNDASVIAYGTVQGTTLPDESRITYDSYLEKKFGKQIDVQEVVSLISSTAASSLAATKQGELSLTDETETPLSKKSRIISLAEFQQQLQEDKLILSKPIPLFVGGG